MRPLNPRPGVAFAPQLALVTGIAIAAAGLELGARANPAQAETPAAQSRPAGEEAQRLLHLADGTVLRGRARLTDDKWEIQAGKEWRTFPSAMVLLALEERDVLAQARKLEQELDAKEPARRVVLADWMTTQGLYAEAVGQLDRVLGADPDQAEALKLVAKLRPMLVLPAIDNIDAAAPDAVLDVLRAIANAPPAVRELGLGRIATLREPKELRATLRAQVTSHSPRLRTVSALALRRLFAPNLSLDEVKGLISRSVLDGSEEVRQEACRALRDVQDETVIGPALKALTSNNAGLRENAIEALGTMGYSAAVEPLMRYLGALNTAAQTSSGGGIAGGSIFIGKQTAYVQDFDVEVAQFQAIADPQINVLIEGSVLDARVIGSYSVTMVAESRRLRSSLGLLTGVEAGNTNKAWLEWWEKHKRSWVTPKPDTGTTQAPRTKP
jgi:HEAT repeat protein